MAAAPSLPIPERLPLDIAAALSVPLPPEAIQPHPTKDFLSTVKAIYVIERLNHVFGIGGWTYTTRIIESYPDNPMVVLLVRFRVPAYGIKLEQYGGSDNKDRGDAYKGAVTDALSKIGSYLGIAMDVYKGGGPTKRNPRGMAVAAPRYTPAQQAIINAKLAPRKQPQPAAAIAESIPEPQDEDSTPYTYEEPESELEVKLAESIGIALDHKARQSMMAAFGEIEQRYRKIGFAPTFGAILGRYCVERADQFSDMDEARSCYREMFADVSKREMAHAKKWGGR